MDKYPLIMTVSLSFVFVVSFILSWFLASSKSPLKITDTPNDRSLHEKPIVRTGGIAILVPLILFWFIGAKADNFPTAMYYGIPGLVFLIATVSFIDDLINLSFLIRLVIHFLAAYLLVWHIISYPSFWLLKIFCCLAVVWMINLYNFMDGMDGFAGGMGLFGFSFMGIAGMQAGQMNFAHISFAIAMANFGFLLWNFPPAKIFMGDVGSTSMGFLASALSLWGVRDNFFPFWFPILVFSPFIWDATITLLRRILVKEKFWQAHKTHLYQQLVQLGWGHRKTVLAEYMLMFMACLSAILIVNLNWHTQVFFLVCWFFLYISLSFVIITRYSILTGK